MHSNADREKKIKPVDIAVRVGKKPRKLNSLYKAEPQSGKPKTTFCTGNSQQLIPKQSKPNGRAYYSQKWGKSGLAESDNE